MPEIVNPETHRERSDVNVRALLWFAAIFIVFAAVTHLTLWLMFKHFARMARQNNAPALTQVVRPANASIPQTPRLQPFPQRGQRGTTMPPNASTPVVDMEEMRATEEQTLNNPGWVDRQRGIVRLPINVAKLLTVQRLNAGERRAAGGAQGAQP
ncbi:MAG TPA: hypothetical protein VEK56_01095 [Vicinamibacterales bacterium]|nr:hypothetical protein [Vicinamibacterales bacterium]